MGELSCIKEVYVEGDRSAQLLNHVSAYNKLMNCSLVADRIRIGEESRNRRVRMKEVMMR